MTSSACTRNTYLANPREPWGFWQALPVAVWNWFSLRRMAVLVGRTNKPRWGSETARRLGRERVAARSRALLRLRCSVVCPTKPPSGYAGLNWLGELDPCASHRIVILCLCLKCCWKPFLLQILPGKCGFKSQSLRFSKKQDETLQKKPAKPVLEDLKLSWWKITWKMIFKISCAKLNSRNL